MNNLAAERINKERFKKEFKKVLFFQIKRFCWQTR